MSIEGPDLCHDFFFLHKVEVLFQLFLNLCCSSLLILYSIMATHFLYTVPHWCTFSLQAGDSTAEELASATQVHGPVMPIVQEKPSVELVKVTGEMKSFKAYDKLRLERMNKRHQGARMKKAAEAEKEDKK